MFGAALQIRSRSLVGGMMAAVVALCGALPAVAQLGPAPSGTVTLSLADVEQRWDTLPAKQQFEILDQLIRQAQFDLADRLLARPHRLGGTDAGIRQFYVGMVRKGQGRGDEAIAIFRDVLASNPGFTRVRLELAHALYAKEDDTAARHNFELVLGGLASNPGLGQAVQSYIAAIDSRKRWDFSTYVSIAPSTNLNQGSSQSHVILTDANGQPLAFELAKANRKTSGVGLVAGAQGSYRQPLTDRLDLIVAGGGSAKVYRESEFGSGLLNASFGPRYRFDWGTVGFHALAERSWASGDAQAKSWGGLLSTTMRFTERDQMQLDLTCSRRDFSHDWRGRDLDYNDGHVCVAAGHLDHYLNSTTFVRGLGGVGRERTGVRHLDNEFWNIGAGVHRELPYGVSLYLQVAHTQRNYDGVFPSTAEGREDRRWDLSANLTKRDWALFGFAPQLQYTFTHNSSNVGFYSYDAHGANLTLTQRY